MEEAKRFEKAILDAIQKELGDNPAPLTKASACAGLEFALHSFIANAFGPDDTIRPIIAATGMSERLVYGVMGQIKKAMDNDRTETPRQAIQYRSLQTAAAASHSLWRSTKRKMEVGKKRPSAEEDQSLTDEELEETGALIQQVAQVLAGNSHRVISAALSNLLAIIMVDSHETIDGAIEHAKLHNLDTIESIKENWLERKHEEPQRSH